MSPFHFCPSAAKNLISFQLLPASLITDLLQLFLGLPLLLFPCGFHNRAGFDISPLQTFVNRCLRFILRIRWPNIISNKDLWKATGQEDINLEIRKRKLRWIGHT